MNNQVIQFLVALPEILKRLHALWTVLDRNGALNANLQKIDIAIDAVEKAETDLERLEAARKIASLFSGDSDTK